MKKNGFTFVELLVVITIIAVVFAAGVVSYTTISKNSRNARRGADLESIRQALELCRSMTGSYPGTIYDDVTCEAGNVTLTTTPKDPKTDTTKSGCTADGKYTYVYTSATNTYTITANCLEGGLPLTLKNP